MFDFEITQGPDDHETCPAGFISDSYEEHLPKNNSEANRKDENNNGGLVLGALDVGVRVRNTSGMPPR